MTTEEFLLEIKSMGLSAVGSDNTMGIYLNKGFYEEIGRCSMTNCGDLSTTSVFMELNEDLREKLLKLMHNYVATPLNKREKEKRYIAISKVDVYEDCRTIIYTNTFNTSTNIAIFVRVREENVKVYMKYGFGSLKETLKNINGINVFDSPEWEIVEVK